MANSKSYKVYFYKGAVTSSAKGASAQNKISISTILSNIQNGKYADSERYNPDDYFYEIDQHTMAKKNGVFYGVFRKFRKTDLPLIGKIGEKQEHDIPLDDEEALIEKNFFLYDTNRNVLLYQSTQPGSKYSILANYIGHVSGTIVDLAIITRMRLDDFLDDPTQRIKSFDIKVARPTNIDDLKNRSDDFSNPVLQFFEMYGANSINLKVSANMRISGEKGFLSNVASLIKEIFARSGEEEQQKPKGKIHFVDNDDNISIVDLLVDSLIAEIQVPTKAKNPTPHSIFDEMKKKLFSDEIQKTLDKCLGRL